MATYNTYENDRPIATAGRAGASTPIQTTVEGEFNASLRNLEAGDVAELIKLPAGTFVHKVFVQVLTGESGQTLNVGDGADPDGYVAAANVATTGTRVMGAGAYADGKFYPAEDTIDIEVPAEMGYAGLRVRVVASVTLMG